MVPDVAGASAFADGYAMMPTINRVPVEPDPPGWFGDGVVMLGLLLAFGSAVGIAYIVFKP